jgi:hypothetical protein
MTDPKSKTPVLVFSYAPPGPYSLAATAARFTRWPEAVDRFDGETYRRPRSDGARVLSRPARAGAGSVEYHADGDAAHGGPAGRPARRRHGLGAALDVRPFYRAFRGDTILERPSDTRGA